MIDRSLVSDGTRQRLRQLVVPVAVAFGRIGVTPNVLTIVGFLGTCLAAAAAATERWLLAGVLVLLFGAFDALDGALARATGRATRFGAFLDSTLDRTGEGLALGGVAFGCAAAGFLPGVGLAVTAVAFASVVTYTRAKAEALDLHGAVGMAPREVRLAILAIGLAVVGLTGGVRLDDGGLMILIDSWGLGRWPMVGALGLIAGLSAITVVQRILYVRQQLDHQDR